MPTEFEKALFISFEFIDFGVKIDLRGPLKTWYKAEWGFFLLPNLIKILEGYQYLLQRFFLLQFERSGIQV